MTTQEKYMEESRKMDALAAVHEMVAQRLRKNPNSMTATAGVVLSQMLFDQVRRLDTALDAVADEAAERLCDVG